MRPYEKSSFQNSSQPLKERNPDDRGRFQSMRRSLLKKLDAQCAREATQYQGTESLRNFRVGKAAIKYTRLRLALFALV